MQTLRSTTLLLTLLAAFFLHPFPARSAPETETGTPTPEPTSEPGSSLADVEPGFANRGKREPAEEASTVFLIPVRQQIGHPQLFLVRRGVEQAQAQNADAIVLLMDTPGGRIDLMREIVNLVIDLDIPTYTLVEESAFSAGAIIALATDHIYMEPRTVIGDAMPVMIGRGGYESLGEAEREKIESGMDAVVRSIAQAKGRDEMLIRAMVRRDLVYTLEDGTVISEEGRILTLTDKEASMIRPNGEPLLSEGTVDDLDAMLEHVGLADAERIELEVTWADDLALGITRVAPLLMTLGMVLLYMEIQSPGVGWPGGLGLAFLLLVMFGHNVAGLAGMGDLVLTVLGIALLMVEVLVIPGFGFAGISGLLLLVWGLIQAMTIRYPGNPGDLPGLVNVGHVQQAIFSVSLAVLCTFAFLLVFLRNLGEHGVLGKGLVLADSLPSSTGDSVREQLVSLIGREGRAVTPLTPSGTVELDGTEYDAVSDGGYVDRDTTVHVVEIRNHRVVVSDYNESSGTPS